MTVKGPKWHLGFGIESTITWVPKFQFNNNDFGYWDFSFDWLFFGFSFFWRK